jgi:glutaredoxin
MDGSTTDGNKPGRRLAEGGITFGDVRTVTLYTRRGCHLCETAEAVLRAERASLAFTLDVVDVDTDPELVRRYGVRVPVVAVDGVEEFSYEVPPDLLRARLRAGGAV